MRLNTLLAVTLPMVSGFALAQPEIRPSPSAPVHVTNGVQAPVPVAVVNQSTAGVQVPAMFRQQLSNDISGSQVVAVPGDQRRFVVTHISMLVTSNLSVPLTSATCTAILTSPSGGGTSSVVIAAFRLESLGSGITWSENQSVYFVLEPNQSLRMACSGSSDNVFRWATVGGYYVPAQ